MVAPWQSAVSLVHRKDLHSDTKKRCLPENRLVLYNTLTESFESIILSTNIAKNSVTGDGKALAWYTCGPTVYDATHLGHARTYVCLDIIRRVLSHGQQSPFLYVMNVTDVDDKILLRAKELNRSPVELARQYEAEFWQDMDSLHVQRPTIVTRVTEHVDSDIIPYIQKLVDTNMAYPVRESEQNGNDRSSVYFDVKAFEERNQSWTKYGKLAPPAISSDFFTSDPNTAGRGKKDARDFVLWKARKEGEDLYWPSPWGDGRPGWHIECSAMIESVQKQFQDSHKFLIHAGGVDLKFPHHTNEIAQAEAFRGKSTADSNMEWIPHWMHTGHLHIGGRKMSKSLKNFITVREMLASTESDASSLASPADDFRLWCLGLSGSYRGPTTYSKDRLEEASIIRQKIVRFLLDGDAWVKKCESLPSEKRWEAPERDLYRLVLACSEKCKEALMGSVSESGGFDVDGAAYLNAMLQIAEEGSQYLVGEAKKRLCPAEPVQEALRVLRSQLDLVGFSNKTVRAGVESSRKDGIGSRIKGGEEALVEQVVKFRSEVRSVAVKLVRNPEKVRENAEVILTLCDDARDNTFPAIGLEIVDEKVQENADVSSNGSGGWRYCVPRKPDNTCPSDNGKFETGHSSAPSLFDIPVEDLFRSGQYEGMFSQYDDTGMPTHFVDGEEISKRTLKKLAKKREKHMKRLDKQ